MGKESVKIIANNKKAWHDYFIEDTYEAELECVNGKQPVYSFIVGVE